MANWSQGVKGPGSDAFNVSPWGKVMTHLKGAKKEGRTLEEVVKEELAKHYDISKLTFTKEQDKGKVLAMLEAAKSMPVDGIILMGMQSQKEIESIFEDVFESIYKKIIMNLSDGQQVALLLKQHVPAPNIGHSEVKIQARDCVDQTVTWYNIEENIKLIPRTLGAYSTHGEEVIIASAGPSLEAHLEEIREKQKAGMKVVCVKHSLPTLLKAGIIPWACVILDPREPKEKSTHGVLRETLFEVIPKETYFFLASITNPNVTRLLIEKGADLWLWHAWSQNSKDFKWPDGTRLITGGTCAALRAMSLFHSMGWRTFHLYGFDFSYEGISEEEVATAKDDEGRQKYYKVTTKGQPDKRFVSTGELMAGSQDLEKLAQNRDIDMNIFMYGSGLAQTMWKEAGWTNRAHYGTVFS